MDLQRQKVALVFESLVRLSNLASEPQFTIMLLPYPNSEIESHKSLPSSSSASLPRKSSTDMSRKRVEFRTYHGVTLRGDYYAVSEAHAPLLIMTQGLTLLKEHHIDITTKRFQVVGIACLVYDHRSWGSSEGTPHQEWNPLQFALDYADAVSFARTLDGIDPERGPGSGGSGIRVVRR